MATPNEQVKPLAPAADCQLRGDEDHEAESKQFKLKQSRYLLCCGCLTVLLLIPVVTLIVIATAFHISDPSIKMNPINFQHLDARLVNETFRNSDENITLSADVSVKNPNVASFKFGNSTATIYYGGMMVGEGKIPAGLAKAKRTLRMNVSVDIIPQKIFSVPSLTSDMSSQELNISSYATIHGRVKVLNIIKKSLVVKMNCTISYNIFSQVVQGNCREHG